MSENQVDIGGNTFKLGKMDTFKQFHVMRKLAPIFSDLLPVVNQLKKGDTDQALSLQPILNGISKLSDHDADFVLMGLLSCVEIKQANNWAKLVTSAGLMFQNLELPVLLNVAGRAFMHNMQSFLAALPQK